MRNTVVVAGDALDVRQRLAGGSTQPAGGDAKLTSSTFLPGTDALSFIGESSAFSSP